MEAEREIGTEFNFTFSPCTLVLYFGCHRVANIFASRKINSERRCARGDSGNTRDK